MTDLTSKSAMRVFDAMTPTHLPAYPGTRRIFVDTGAGMRMEDGTWLPSWWEQGWNGPKEKVNRELLKHTIGALPEDAIWILNIREGEYDIRNRDNGKVEKTIDFLRDNILIPVHEFRPGIKRGFYGSIHPEQYGITMYHKAKLIKERTEAGEVIPGSAWWLASFPQFEAAYLAWYRANVRLTYGFDANGKLDPGGGLLDALDIITPSNYVTDDLNDGPDDPIDIESDTLFIGEQTRVGVQFADGKPVIPLQSPYRKNTGHAVKMPRLKNAAKVAKDNGAHGVGLWYYVGVRKLNKVETDAFDAVKGVFGRAA